MIDALLNVAYSRPWLCALSGSVHGRVSELMLTKGARFHAHQTSRTRRRRARIMLWFSGTSKQSVVLNSQAFIETTEYISARVGSKAIRGTPIIRKAKQPLHLPEPQGIQLTPEWFSSR
jgi:hypothetical protein